MPDNDIQILRDLARKYAEAAAKPVQEERRQLWADHNSLRPTRTPVMASFGMHNVWCREMFGPAALLCRDPSYRNHERAMRMALFHDSVGDDFVIEPWLGVAAVQPVNWTNLWGLSLQHEDSHAEGGAWKFKAAIRDWADADKLVAPSHAIDEAATAAEVQRIGDAVGDILTINVERGPACMGFMADISTHLAQLRGLEQLMIDMYESPEQLHRVLAFMRDGILGNQAAAETAGDYGLTSQSNQCMTYCRELPRRAANARPAARKQLWCFSAAQEFTLVSPAMHDEFMLQYQKPIMENFGLSHYGCCEDLTRKIDMLRQVRNLRIIAVTPRADVARCAEQIGTDYVISWRPNPADVLCCGWDEARVRKLVRHAADVCRGLHMHVHLKDIETLEGDYDRLARCVRVIRDECEKTA